MNKKVGMDIVCELSSVITSYIVNNFTDIVLEEQLKNGDIVYSDKAQDIFNNILDKVDGILNE